MTDGTLSPERAPAGDRSHAEIMIVITGLLLGMLLAALDQTIVSTALTTILYELHGATHLSWVITAYLLTSTASTPLYGKVGDLYGRKKIFLFAVIVFLLGSVLCGAAQNIGQLIAFRALQGVGAGGLFSLSMAIVGDIVPARQRGRYQGYFGATFGLASVVGPIVGGFFTDTLSWRWVFYINVPIGLIALVVISTRLHLPKFRTSHKIDYLGAALLTGTVTTLLLALVWGGGHPGTPFTGYPWNSQTILGLMLASLSLLIFFLLQESRHPEPILPLTLFSNPVFRVSVALSFVTGGTMFGAIVFIPQFQQIVKGYSPTKSGLLMIPLMFGIVFGTTWSGKMITKLGRYKVFAVAGTTVTSIGFLMLSMIKLHTSQALLSLDFVVIGVGVGLFLQVSVLAVQNSVEFRHMGAATSATLFFRTLGGSFGIAVFGSILNNRLRFTLPQYLDASEIARVNLDRLKNDYILSGGPRIAHGVFESYAKAVHVVFLWAVMLALVSVALAFVLPEQPLRTHSGARDAAARKAGQDSQLPALD